MEQKVKVVIADDSAIIRERVRAVLEESPHIEVVGEVEDGPAAVESMHLYHPDALILDVSMPGGGGMAALKEIKQARPLVVVIMLTNHPYPSYRKMAMEAGATHFLNKSTEFEQVRHIVDALMPVCSNEN